MGDDKVSLSLKILKKSTSLQSYKKGDSLVTYFNVVAANKDSTFIVRIYLKHKFNFIKEGMSYRFTDMIKKGDTYWAVSTTTVGCIAPLKNVATADIELPENEKAEGAPRSLMDALQCPQKSSVKGKIVQISPLKRRRNGTLVVRSISLKDTSGVAKVCLFEGTAEMQFERDQILEVTSVYPKSFQGAQQLTGSVSTKCQFVQDENFNDLQVTDEDFLEDHDFDVEEDLSNGDPFQVIMISDAYRYLCCPSPGCRKKKIIDKKCPICGKESNNTYGIRITVEAQNCKTNESTTTSLFNDDVTNFVHT